MRLSGRVRYNLDTRVLGLLDLLHRHLWISFWGRTRLATERDSCHYRSGALASPRTWRVLAVQGILKVDGRGNLLDSLLHLSILPSATKAPHSLRGEFVCAGIERAWSSYSNFSDSRMSSSCAFRSR